MDENANYNMNKQTEAINDAMFEEVKEHYMEQAVEFIKKPGMIGRPEDIPSIHHHNHVCKVIPIVSGLIAKTIVV